MELFESKKKVTEKDLVLFTRQFSTMIGAGLPMVQCLDIFAKQSENKTFGDTIRDVKSNIEIGSNLFDALRKHPQIRLTAFIAIWSMQANLEEHKMLFYKDLAGYIEKALALKKKLNRLWPILDLLFLLFLLLWHF